MKLIKTVVTIFILLTAIVGHSQQSIVFEKTYRTETIDTVIMANSGVQTSDGGYLLGGYAAYGMYLAQMMFFKIDSVGNYQWKKMYGSLPCSSNMIYDMEPVGDGTFICCGEGTFSTEGEPGDLKPTNSMIMRVDENANIIWHKEFDAGWHECLYELALSDTGYLCVGYKQDMTKDPGHFLWIAGDVVGSSSKLSTLDMGLGWQSLKGVSQNSTDNVFVAAGSCDNRSCILTISYEGDTIRTIVLGSGFPEQYSINSITVINTNKIVFGGSYIEEHPSDSTNAFLASINSNPEENIFMVLPNENEYKQNNLRKILNCYDGGFLTLGMLQTYDRGSEIWIRKFDENFDLLWKRYLGGEYGETFRDVIKTSDDGYLIIGESSSFNIYTSLYLVKTDSLGLGNYTSQVMEYKIPLMDFVVYPNPADSYFIINPDKRFSEIMVFDNFGKIVIRAQTTDNQATINTEHLPSGVYMVKSVSEDKVNTSKLIINH